MKASLVPHKFSFPLDTSILYPTPIVVEDVIGYAQEPSVIWLSTQTILPAPSVVVGIPGY
jgi:hypothetical protein